MMQPHLHICTVASQHVQGLDQLLDSCKYFRVSLHILGEDKPFHGFAEKFFYIQDFIKPLPDHDIVLFLDAYDALLLATSDDILKQFLKMKAHFIISAEKYCYPDPELAPLHPPSPTSFKYVNSGTYIGYVHALKEFFKAIAPFEPQDNDQHLMMRYFINNPDKITLDTRCELFLPTYELKAVDIEIDAKMKRAKCIETNSTPCIVHGARKSLWYQFLYDALFKKPYKSKEPDDKTVFLSILARDNAPFLPKYLEAIDKLDYKKKHITVSIQTFNNSDETKEILQKWMQAHQNEYKEILFEEDDILNLPPSQYSPQRFKIPGTIRNRSLKIASSKNCDYYFVVDCDNFIAPCTLKELIAKEKPIIAPLLHNFPPSPDLSSNFFACVTDDGHFQEHPDYLKILKSEKVGIFKVPLVLGTCLIQKSALSKLSYIDETFDPEYIIFARSARKGSVDQYISNERDFGFMIHLTDYPSIEEAALLETFLE